MLILTVLGSSGSYPSGSNAASGYLVRSRTTTVVLDLGSGALVKLLGEVGAEAVDAVVISHVHADHCSDLFSFYMARARSVAVPTPLPVFVPAGAAEHFIRFARAEDADHPFQWLMDFRAVSGGDEALVGEVALAFATTNHPVPTIATRVASGGVSLVYTADTGPSDEVAALAGGADALLCEAAMIGERDHDTYPFHLTAEEAGRLAAQAEVGHLIVTHIPPSLTPEPSIQAAREAYPGRVSLAVPGAEWTIE